MTVASHKCEPIVWSNIPVVIAILAHNSSLTVYTSCPTGRAENFSVTKTEQMFTGLPGTLAHPFRTKEKMQFSQIASLGDVHLCNLEERAKRDG